MERWIISLQGLVQGVGFRPYIFNLARRLHLGGLVRNQQDGLAIAVEGTFGDIRAFLAELTARPPPLAVLGELQCRAATPSGSKTFAIQASTGTARSATLVSPDVGTCEACLSECADPRDRRYRYPFLNCTGCGPRLTIITALPYDRERTTMATFAMCEACTREFADPADRRFHAQPTACPACGPRLEAVDSVGNSWLRDAAFRRLMEALRGGEIAAIKGLGGFHFACDATCEAAVQTLRLRKRRPDKPLAVMVGALAEAERLCRVSPAERALLSSWRRPIVVMQRREGNGLAPSVAPGGETLGVMLPYTPLHYLVMNELSGQPLVMTSGNLADEPIVVTNHEAQARLAPVADLLVTHDRAINAPCDDSVVRVIGETGALIRRSRGYAPQPVLLPVACAVPMLAVGGQGKATFCLGRGRHGFLSQHVGDLSDARTLEAFRHAIALYEQLFGVRPEILVHDLHPDYQSTRYAQGRVVELAITGMAAPMRCFGVQHHHAHMASCMAEHRLSGPVIGVCWDGSGYGTDGAVWGGEFLVGDYCQVYRAAHLRYVGLPGGERAAREPWRMAASHLRDAGADSPGVRERRQPREWDMVQTMLSRSLNTPPTSSVGRLFDAVAAIIGLRDVASYEGQAASELEAAAAADTPAPEVFPFALDGAATAEGGAFTIDTRPLIRAIAQASAAGVHAGAIARRFHETLSQIVVAVCDTLRRRTGIDTVVLSGGVFLNRVLTESTEGKLGAAGLRVHRHLLVPANDGGLSLGQLAVGAATFSESTASRRQRSYGR